MFDDLGDHSFIFRFRILFIEDAILLIGMQTCTSETVVDIQAAFAVITIVPSSDESHTEEIVTAGAIGIVHQ